MIPVVVRAPLSKVVVETDNPADGEVVAIPKAPVSMNRAASVRVPSWRTENKRWPLAPISVSCSL